MLTTTNPRILKFYQDNPSIHFETVNLIFIDLFDKLLQDPANLMNSTVNGQLLAMVSQLNESMSSLSNNIANNMYDKMCDIKKEYIEDVKSIINNNNSEKLRPLLEKNNSMLIEKTSSLLHDIIPRSNDSVHNTIKAFHKSIVDDTNQLLHNDGTSMKEFIANFENKTSNMLQNIQQPIYSFISSSEDRIQSNIKALKDITVYKSNVISNSDDSIIRFLSQNYSTADISVLNTSANSSVHMVKRQYKQNIVIYSVHSDVNISVDEIKQFMQFVDEYRCHGIFVSHKTGISSKSNYQIDIHNGYVLTYIHNVCESLCKLNVAIDVIDNLSAKIKLFTHGNNNTNPDNSIPKDVLEEINRDFQLFISQKEIIITIIKENHKKILSIMDDFKFSALDKYLSSKFIMSNVKTALKCDLCKQFNAHNLKALAAHKRGCIRKNLIDKENVIC
jgi:gas vesicle protein